MKSILKEFYKELDRPISQKELNILNKKNFKNLKLSTLETYHTKTKHFYLLKKGGKKEKDALKIHNNSQSYKNIGSCSVSWKLRATPEELRPLAEDIVKEYERVFTGRPLYQEDRYLTHYEVELTRIFYIWLYYEQYDNDLESDNNV